MSCIYKSDTVVPRWPRFEDLGLGSTSNLHVVPAESETLAELLRPQNRKSHRGDSRSSWGWHSSLGNTEFSPEVDVFDTPTSYAIHVSLPGARKEDIGVNYDEDKSEIHISGVVLRGGNRDEEFLKALTLSERDAGLFEKKVRLGNRSHPAAVDTDGITAKLDSGVLEIFIPKRVVEVIEKKVQVD